MYVRTRVCVFRDAYFRQENQRKVDFVVSILTLSIYLSIYLSRKKSYYYRISHAYFKSSLYRYVYKKLCSKMPI